MKSKRKSVLEENRNWQNTAWLKRICTSHANFNIWIER
jgi:hypothetical protein